MGGDLGLRRTKNHFAEIFRAKFPNDVFLDQSDTKCPIFNPKDSDDILGDRLPQSPPKVSAHEGKGP